MASPNDAPTRMLSAQVETVLWESFDAMVRSTRETKRSHLEKALLAATDRSFFESNDDYERLAKKYGIVD